jgi:hypothetical protein
MRLTVEFHSSPVEALKLPTFLSPASPSQPTRKTQVILNTNEFTPFSTHPLPNPANTVKPAFTFQTKSAFAGSPVSFQLTLTSHSRKLLSPITFSTATLTFNEQIPEIVVEHTDTGSDAIQKFAGNVTKGDADLGLRPGQAKAFQFSYTPIAQAQIEVTHSLFLVTN